MIQHADGTDVRASDTQTDGRTTEVYMVLFGTLRVRNPSNFPQGILDFFLVAIAQGVYKYNLKSL